MEQNQPANIYDTLQARRPESAQAYSRACQVIPSGTVSRARILPPFPFYTVRGRGAHLYDIDGNEYVDCGMGFGSHMLGHAHPLVVQAIQSAVEDGTGYGTPHLREVELAELLVQAIPCADKVTFCNSGSEATLNAIRLARAATGKMVVNKEGQTYTESFEYDRWLTYQPEGKYLAYVDFFGEVTEIEPGG